MDMKLGQPPGAGDGQGLCVAAHGFKRVRHGGATELTEDNTYYNAYNVNIFSHDIIQM